MRVITGTARGKRLNELPGMDTRPTTDRVKEGLFNVIQFDIEGRRVLDLFAGTGQLGIETLSRGASYCDFVDSSRVAVGIIKDNLRLTGLEERASVHQRDFAAFLKAAQGMKYGLVFLDPPYAQTSLEEALKTIVEIDIVAGNGIIICESALDKQLPDLPDPYEKGKEYRYGKIKVTIYRRRV